MVTIEFDGSLELPLNYGKIIQGFIYNNIMDKDLAKFIHDSGFTFNNRKYKMFTFSRLNGSFKINKELKKIVYQSPIKLVVSSCYEDFFIDLSLSLIQKEVRIGNKNANISKMEIIIEDPAACQKIRMISPVTIYSTINDGRTIYFSPENFDFKRLIKENIIKKYRAFYKDDQKEIFFDIQPCGRKYNRVISKYDDFIIEGWLGDFMLKGDKDIIKLAYDTGIGGKNSQGFGCFELI